MVALLRTAKCLCTALLLCSSTIFAADDPQIGEKKLSEWRTALAAAQDNERSRMLHALTNTRPLPAALLPVLLELLPEGERDWPRSRQTLPWTLCRVCEDAPETIPQLLTELDKGPEGHHTVVLAAVHNLGIKGRSAAPKLLELAADTKRTRLIRSLAISTIGRIKPPTAQALPTLLALLKDPEKEIRRPAVEAIGTLGAEAKEAVPVLLALMQNANEAEQVRDGAAQALGNMGSAAKDAIPALIEAARGFDIESYAIQALGLLGPDAAPAVPTLMKKLEHRNPVFIGYAVRALGRIGAAAKPAIPQLIQLLKHQYVDLRQNVTLALGGIGPDAAEALPSLLESTRDGARSVSSSAFSAIARIAITGWFEGTCDRPAMETLFKENPARLGETVWSLMLSPNRTLSIETRMRRAIPRWAVRYVSETRLINEILACAEKDDNEEVRKNGAVAREELATKTMQSLPKPVTGATTASGTEVIQQTKPMEPEYQGRTLNEWLVALRSNDLSVKMEATRALPHLGPEGMRAFLHNPDENAFLTLSLSDLKPNELESVAPVLIEALRYKELRVRRVAPRLIVQLSAGAKKTAVPELIRALKDDEDVPVRYWVAEALGQIGPDAKEAVPALILALQHEDRLLQRHALGALAGIGPGAKDAVRVLLDRFRNDKKDFDRCQNLHVLGKIGPATPEVIPTLLGALKDAGHNTRSFAAQALGEIRAVEAVAALTEIVKNTQESAHVRQSATNALGMIGPAAKDAVAPLAALSREPKAGWDLRGNAMAALVRIDREATTVLPVLQEALADVDPLVRIRAADSLCEMGERAKPALPALTKLLTERQVGEGASTARLKAIEAIAKIGPSEQAFRALEVAEKDPNSIVARVAKETLQKLKSGRAGTYP